MRAASRFLRLRLPLTKRSLPALSPCRISAGLALGETTLLGTEWSAGGGDPMMRNPTSPSPVKTVTASSTLAKVDLDSIRLNPFSSEVPIRGACAARVPPPTARSPGSPPFRRHLAGEIQGGTADPYHRVPPFPTGLRAGSGCVSGKPTGAPLTSAPEQG